MTSVRFLSSGHGLPTEKAGESLIAAEGRLIDFVNNVSGDNPENIVLSDEQASKFEELLQPLGIMAPSPTEEDIADGVNIARSLVENGQAEAELFKQSKDFFGPLAFADLSEGSRSYEVMWNRSTPFYVDPEAVKGAAFFINWMGRSDSSKSIQQGGRKVTIPSREVVKQYAVRPTKIPDYEPGELALLITDKGPIAYAIAGGHRTAAARLRGGEPIGFNSIIIRDARVKN